MLNSPYVATTLLAVLLGSATVALAQDEVSQFTPENAILNTSIPFAIGAREARQELRGAFGWSTFQEGLVEGVYFRFDPDGYARFSPTPRLDSNVFEVICRPRTTSCMGRKATLSLYLTGDGSLQIQLEDFAPGDTLHLIEGVTNLPLPEQTLTSLDSRLETLLSSGGDLVVKRGEQTVSSTSLSGFGAVAAYLRWITAQQDYTVLPRDWPVPGAEPLVAQPLTQAPNRQIAVSQPQSRPVFDTGEQGRIESSTTNDISEVRVELDALRDLLSSRNATEDTGSNLSDATHEFMDHDFSDGLRTLHKRIDTLENSVLHLQRLFLTDAQHKSSSQQFSLNPSIHENREMAPTIAQEKSAKSMSLAERLEYLITEIGLDAETALMLATREPAKDQSNNNHVEEYAARTETVVSEILEELRDQLPGTPSSKQTEKPQNLEEISNSRKPQMDAKVTASDTRRSNNSNEYQVLTDYFASVFGG